MSHFFNSSMVGPLSLPDRCIAIFSLFSLIKTQKDALKLFQVRASVKLIAWIKGVSVRAIVDRVMMMMEMDQSLGHRELLIHISTSNAKAFSRFNSGRAVELLAKSP